VTFRRGAYVIIGGAGGIGRAAAQALLGHVDRLLLVDRDAPALAEASRELGTGDATVTTRPLDVSSASAWTALAADLRASDPIAGLVNAAGVLQLGTIREVSDSDWDHVLDVNLKGTFLACRAFIPLLANGGGGAIVNVASISGRTKSYFSAPNYVASKAGVIGLTMVLAAQHAAEGVRVNCVAPGVVDTPMLAPYSDEQRAALAATIPVGRLADPAEIGDAVAYLLSEQSSYITGQTLNVNGGQFMQ
jgi:NAD(P)-dependent dehydrogenase (short-subunit alcohol dehydrogenase family)